MTSTRFVLAALLFLTLTLAGCGGGDDATPPPAGSAITIAAGGTVTSNDGKLQLIVGANSASAEGTAMITKAAPPADVLAEPSYLAVASGTTVRAVGNTFIPGTQGATAQGKYQLGTAPCGPLSCDVTSTGSSGANFRITSGTLRLPE